MRRARTGGIVAAAIAALTLSVACGPPTGPPSSTPTSSTSSSTTTSTTTTTAAPDPCARFASGVRAANLATDQVTEASGLAASRRTAGVYWLHNDSGDSPRVFATDLTGAHRGTWSLTGAQASDWEDLAVGPGPQAGTSYLYVGDIGGNAGRNHLVVYRVPEPAVAAAGQPSGGALGGVEAIAVRYPDDARYDAESLFVDTNGDIYVVTKSGDGRSRLFRLPAADATPGAEHTFTAVGEHLFAPSGASGMATGADLSADGSLLVVRTYDRAHTWRRPAGTTVAEVFAAASCETPTAAEGQGEAIAVHHDGTGLVTTTEGSHPPLHTYARR